MNIGMRCQTPDFRQVAAFSRPESLAKLEQGRQRVGKEVPGFHPFGDEGDSRVGVNGTWISPVLDARGERLATVAPAA